MKHLNKLFVALVMLAGFSSQAQDNNNPWAISFGANAVDTRVSAASSLEDQFSQFFNAKDNDSGYPWPIWSSLGWGIGLAFHFAGAYVFPKANSVEKEYEKLTNKNNS